MPKKKKNPLKSSSSKKSESEISTTKEEKDIPEGYKKLFSTNPKYKITTFEKGSRSIIYLKQSSLQKIYLQLGLPWNKVLELLKLRLYQGEQKYDKEEFMKDNERMNLLESKLDFYDVRLNNGLDRVDITKYSFEEILKKMNFDKNDLLELLDFIVTNNKTNYNTPHFQNLLEKAKNLKKKPVKKKRKVKKKKTLETKEEEIKEAKLPTLNDIINPNNDNNDEKK